MPLCLPFSAQKKKQNSSVCCDTEKEHVMMGETGKTDLDYGTYMLRYRETKLGSERPRWKPLRDRISRTGNRRAGGWGTMAVSGSLVGSTKSTILLYTTTLQPGMETGGLCFPPFQICGQRNLIKGIDLFIQTKILKYLSLLFLKQASLL